MPDAISTPHNDPRLIERWGFDPETKRETFSRIARLAQTVAATPMARVFLEDGETLWSAGSIIPGPLPTMNREAMAGLLAPPGESRWIEDTRADPTVRDHGLVVGRPWLRFVACAPIVMSDGQSIGGLYVSDRAPRAFDPKVAEDLRDLADLVAQACERPRLLRELAHAEAEAAAAAKVTAAFVESSPVALAMTDRECRILHVSPQWRGEMGMIGTDVVGRSLYDLFPRARGRQEEAFNRVLAGETIREDRTQIFLPNGEEPWVRAELTPWRDADGEVGGMLCMTHDVTAMVRALEQSERSKRRLKLAAEIADVHAYEMDYVNQTLLAEGAFDSFFDRSMTYQDFRDDPTYRVHPDDAKRVAAIWRECAAAGRPFRAEYRLRPVNGRDVWVFGGAELMMSADGRPQSVIGVLQNITARKEAELAVAQARDSAEAANRAKSEFLANMSHEIRTPLNGVMGVAGALGRTDLSAQQQDMVRLIETSAQTLESLLSDVLDLARIESGRLTLTTAPFSMEDAVNPVAALFEPNARCKGLDFQVDLPEAATGVFAGDVARIRQILSNLVSNAVKFTSRGGVRLSVAAEPSGESASLVRFTVEDSGIGFGAETQSRLFERFEQADGSITRRYGGTGLGLAISRSLAEEMGGSLTATSSPGQGARFCFTLELPRRDEARALAPLTPLDAETCAPGQGGFAPRVLLAEDHPTNRKVVELILGAIGVNLTSVENGQEALDAFESQAFDLILMDMQMPVMDGLTAIRAIREQEAAERRPRTPIYALTANAMPEHAEASRHAGADAHLTKPIAADALIAAVRQIAAPDEPELVLRSA